MTLTEKPPTNEAQIEASPSRRRAPRARIVGGLVLVLIGTLWLLERTGTIDITSTAVLGLGTLVTGVALMLLANRGPHGGLIALGTILAVVTLLTAAAPFEGFQGGIGDRTVALTSVEGIKPDYNLAMGTMTLDLREIDDFEATTQLTASVGMGELVVRVPEDIDIAVETRVGAGEFEMLGSVVDGVGLDESYASPGSRSGSETLSLHISVFMGRVEVTDG